MIHLSRITGFSVFQKCALVLFVLVVASLGIGQTQKQKPANGADEEPLFNTYRGVQLGWIADEVRKKLGAPNNKGDDQDLYVINEKEMAQVVYDKATRAVTTISVDFLNGATEVITPQQVFGSDIEAKPDGSKYRMVRYPKVGYWVSYNRTAGATPIVTVTLQKMLQ